MSNLFDLIPENNKEARQDNAFRKYTCDHNGFSLMLVSVYGKCLLSISALAVY